MLVTKNRIGMIMKLDSDINRLYDSFERAGVYCKSDRVWALRLITAERDESKALLKYLVKLILATTKDEEIIKSESVTMYELSDIYGWLISISKNDINKSMAMKNIVNEFTELLESYNNTIK